VPRPAAGALLLDGGERLGQAPGDVVAGADVAADAVDLVGRDVKDVITGVLEDKIFFIAAGGMGYFIYYVWTWVTTEIKPVIGQANGTLIALIDRIRMLDNDLIRLNQKVETVMELRGKTIRSLDVLFDLLNLLFHKNHSLSLFF
jgi:hypothetical protein